MSKIIDTSPRTSPFLPARNRSSLSHRPLCCCPPSFPVTIWAVSCHSSSSRGSCGGSGSWERSRLLSPFYTRTLPSRSRLNDFRCRERHLSAPLFSLFLHFCQFRYSPNPTLQSIPLYRIKPAPHVTLAEANSKGDGEVGSGVEATERPLGIGLEGEDRWRIRKQPGRSEGRGTFAVGKMGDLFDLEKQFAFYGSYHSNKMNIAIHMVFVWPIYFTSLILWAYTPALVPLPLAAGTLPLQQYMVVNWGFFQAALYGFYYIALDKKAGFLGALICFGCWIAANAIAQNLPWSLSWKIVLASQVTCWFFQIYGHQKFEGRAPALLDNLPQAFVMAPFFVLLEFLQGFGYEPYPGFHKKVQKSVDDAIREFRSSKEKKAA